MNSSTSFNSTSLISIKGAGKSYGNHQALHNVDWHVGEGDWWGVVGPNGSGKSTLIQLIAGTEQLNEGQIRIDGRDIGSYSRKDLSRMIAVLQQDGLPAISYPVRTWWRWGDIHTRTGWGGKRVMGHL